MISINITYRLWMLSINIENYFLIVPAASIGTFTVANKELNHRGEDRAEQMFLYSCGQN